MTGLDIFVLILLCAAAIWGYTRGIVVQMGSLLAFALAIAACRIFGDAATSAVMAMMGGETAVTDPAQSLMSRFMAECIANVALFLIVWIGVWFLSRAVKFVAKSLRLGFLDSLAGALFMLLKAGLVVSFIINFARFAAPNSALAQAQGWLMGGVADLAPQLLGFIQPMAS